MGWRIAALLVAATLALPTFAAAQGAGNMGENTGGTNGQGGADTTSTVTSAPSSAVVTSGAGTAGGNGSGGSGTTGGNGGGGAPPTTGGGGSANAGGANAGGVNAGGGGEEEFGNNLSFPVVATDGFMITPVATSSFNTPYTGPYTGLSDTEYDALLGHQWFAQKTEGNLWQAAQMSVPSVSVYGLDWGDIVEAVHPLVGQPFRVEVTPYVQLDTPLPGYQMALLANPSSKDEVQGTNKITYNSAFATVASDKPEMVIQYLGDLGTDGLVWNGSAWTRNGMVLPITEVNFGPELNVAGKYTYGEEKGGWRPVQTGMYRLTFALPDSGISLANAVVGNFADWTAGTTTEETEEPRAGMPVIDPTHNISYVDVTVVTQREGTPPTDPGDKEGGEETTTTPTVTTSLTAVNTTPETALTVTAVPVSTEGTATGGTTQQPYLTDYLRPGGNNDPHEVVLLQDFLNKDLGTLIPLTGVYDAQTTDAVKAFQRKYASDILQPWTAAGYTDPDLQTGTGVVYVTTLAKINELAAQ